MPPEQTSIPGTAPATPAAPVVTTPAAPAPATPAVAAAPAATPAAAPTLGVDPAQNPAGQPAATIGAPSQTGDPGPTVPVEVTVPEGYDANLFQVDVLKANAKSSEEAQRTFDHSVEVARGLKAAQDSAWNEMNTRNIEAIKRDPETGGSDFDTKITAVNRFLEANFSQESRAMFAELGNDLHFVKDMMRLSKHFSEDSVALQGGATQETDERAKQRARYPNSPEMFEGQG